MELINEYHAGIKLINFPNLHENIDKEFDIVVDTCIDVSPRYWLHKRIAFMDIIYYINLLYDNNPSSVIDVGCGECVWKEYFPNIIGFDPSPSEYSNYDFIDYFDEDFSKSHVGKYTCGMALNSIHFDAWDKLKNNIHLAMDMVTDRFLFTINCLVIQGRIETKLNNGIDYINDILASLPYKVMMLDYPVLRGYSTEIVNNNAGFNGHVRFILEHRK